MPKENLYPEKIYVDDSLAEYPLEREDLAGFLSEQDEDEWICGEYEFKREVIVKHDKVTIRPLHKEAPSPSTKPEERKVGSPPFLNPQKKLCYHIMATSNGGNVIRLCSFPTLEEAETAVKILIKADSTLYKVMYAFSIYVEKIPSQSLSSPL